MRPKVRHRRKYLVNKNLQLSYSWLLIVCVGLVILIFGLSLWYLNKIHLDLFQKIVGEKAMPEQYISSIQNQFLIGIPLAIAVISCLLLFMGIYTSHRIAGPMYRMTKSMNMIGIENRLDAIQIRKKDQLREMADAFNYMVHTLKDRTYQDMRLLDHVRGKIKELYDSIRGESIDIRKLSNQVKDIERLATELRNKKEA